MDRHRQHDDTEVVKLLEGIRVRDDASLTKLHALMSRRIHTFAMRIVGDNALANEIAMDTLYDVWKYPDRYNGTSKASTWILAIAKYKALHALRKRSPNEVDLNDLADTLISDRGDPEASSLAMERNRALLGCLQQLPEVQRECLNLAFFEGLPLAEVGAIQGVPENTVKTRIFHARRKLQAWMAELLE